MQRGLNAKVLVRCHAVAVYIAAGAWMINAEAWVDELSKHLAHGGSSGPLEELTQPEPFDSLVRITQIGKSAYLGSLFFIYYAFAEQKSFKGCEPRRSHFV